MIGASLTSLPPSSWTSPPPPPSSPSSSTDCSAPTKTIHPDALYSNASNTRDNRRVLSHNRWHQPALLSATKPGISTAQTDPDKAEYADAPNTNPAGESDIV